MRVEPMQRRAPGLALEQCSGCTTTALQLHYNCTKTELRPHEIHGGMRSFLEGCGATANGPGMEMRASRHLSPRHGLSPRQGLAGTLVALAVTLPGLGWSAEDRYGFCSDRAREMSGYVGAVPAEYEEDVNVLKGALAGAAGGAAIGWVADKDQGDAAKRGAAAGALIGLLRRADQEKKRRRNAERRRQYQMELEACMAGGRR